MAKAKNRKNAKAKSNDKLKMLKDLPTCMVVLHNIALDKDLVQLYQLRFSEKKKEELEHSSPCINTSKNSFNNVWMLKENIQEDTVDETSRVTRSLRKLSKKKNEECKNLKLLNNVSHNEHLEVIQSRFAAHEQQLKPDTSVKSFSSKSNETSCISSNTCSHIQEKVVPISNKRCSNRRPRVQKKNVSKRKAYFESGSSLESVKMSSDSESYLNEKNLATTNYNTKMQDTCDKTDLVLQMKSDTDHCSVKKCNNNNLCTADITNRMICTVKLQQCETNPSKALLSGIINTDNKIQNKTTGTSEDSKTNLKSKNTNLSDNFSTYDNINESQNEKDTKKKSSNTSLTADSTIQATGVSESLVLKSVNSTELKTNRVTTTPPDFFTNVTKQCANKTNSKTTVKNLPKITENHILPKGTIKIMKVNTSDKNLQNSFSEQVFLEQNRYDTNGNAKQVSHVDSTLESTSILREKECTSEINRLSVGSINTLKISEPTLALNNNINLRNKNIDDNELLSSKIDHKNDFSMEVRSNIHNNVNAYETDSETTYKDISNHQEQSNELDNDEKHENHILQHDKKNITNSDKNILNKNTSNLDVSEKCNAELSILTNKEKVIKQNRKRIAEENITDITLNSKKKRLNRTIWLQNNVNTKSLNFQQFNDFSNINTTITAKSNIAEESNSKKQDLRECLNQKSLKQSSKLSTSENKFNNNNSVESKQIDLNNENDAIILTNTTRDEEFHKRLSFDEEPVLTKTLCKDKDIQMDPVCNNHMFCRPLQSISKTQHINQKNKHTNENINIQKRDMTDKNKDDNNDDDNNDDDNCNDCDNDNEDCISLFAESFDTNLCESVILSEQKKSSKSLHFDAPYVMTNSSFNKYVTQNATEFNKEYAKYEQDNVEISNKTDERKFNNQLRQTIHTDCVPETTTVTKVISTEAKNVELKYQYLNSFRNLVTGYCFPVLRKSYCYKQSQCQYKHDLQDLVNAVCSRDSKIILNMMQDALYYGYNYLCRTIYVTSLHKLSIEQILIMYRKIHDIYIVRDELTIFSKNYVTQKIIIELLSRQMSLKTIVDCLMEYITLTSNNLTNVLMCIEKHIKHGEYWSTLRTLVLRLLPNIPKSIIQKILVECIESEKLTDIKDVNDNLINKVSPALISTLDKDIVERFKKSLLADKTENNSCPTVIQNFGETIASPDGDTNLSQTEFSKHNNTSIDKSTDGNNDRIIKVNEGIYELQPIDNLPDARSVYRDHEHLWKFYVDLDRFKKGLVHHDYDYVINILKSYADRQDETSLFVRSCCSILRAEIKRSEYHVANILRRTGKMLFDIKLDILTSLVDKEAWRLALWFIQSLDTNNLPCNAEYFLLLAEIYLANKKAVKAYDLLKYHNIICTSRDKWHVKSTINDERVRSKIMYILLDSFCNKLVEHAFVLFQFLLKDQSSQYYPIDLSCYVDKLIILSLTKNDTNLIIEMANLILKYTFALSTTTCRALISTLIHLDENLTRQIYNYAEGMGIYPRIKLWPVTYIIISNDLTEEEIYLTFLQLLKNITLNFGHAIEFAKPHQIKVYLILEIKSTNEQFHYTELQDYCNNKAIINIKTLIRNVLKKRFDPPILLMPGSKGRICKLQSKSLINYLKTEHCN